MKIRNESIRTAARLSKGLSIEANLNSEYVAIWADGRVSVVDCGTIARGSMGGWERPILSLYAPTTVKGVKLLIEEMAL